MRHHGRPPLAVFKHHWGAIVDDADQPVTSSAAGAAVFAACAVGNPTAFLAQADAAMKVVGRRVWPDHHAFTHAEATALAAEARKAGATAILVTEKDWVKLRHVIESPPSIPFWRPVLSVACVRGEKELEQLLIEATRAVTAPL